VIIEGVDVGLQGLRAGGDLLNVKGFLIHLLNHAQAGVEDLNLVVTAFFDLHFALESGLCRFSLLVYRFIDVGLHFFKCQFDIDPIDRFMGEGVDMAMCRCRRGLGDACWGC
jgi:hypothetical protein